MWILLRLQLDKGANVDLPVYPYTDEPMLLSYIESNPGDRMVIPGIKTSDGDAYSCTISEGGMATMEGTFDLLHIVNSSLDIWGNRSIHRFKGECKIGNDLPTIIGKGKEGNRLTFGLLEDVGYIYMRGYGTVIYPDGRTVQLGDPVPDGETALMAASEKGYTEIVKLLLDYGAKVDLQDVLGKTALYKASEKGHQEVVKLLLDKGANTNLPDVGKTSALSMAAWKRHLGIVELLLKKGATDIHSDALVWASMGGNIEIVKLLIKNGMGLLSEEGLSDCLRAASENGNAEVVNLLIDEGANVNSKTSEGYTALYLAAYDNHTEVVRLLIDKGAAVDQQIANGFTALMLASRDGFLEIVKILLEKKANVDLQSSSNYTALYLASYNGHAEIVKLLLDNGANPDIKSKEGKTAYDVAKNGEIRALITSNLK